MRAKRTDALAMGAAVRRLEAQRSVADCGEAYRSSRAMKPPPII